LVPTLLNAIRVDDVLRQQRAMLTFYRVVKALASRRLPPDRKIFEEVSRCSNIFVCADDFKSIFLKTVSEYCVTLQAW
jgi:hypothetical protein